MPGLLLDAPSNAPGASRSTEEHFQHQRADLQCDRRLFELHGQPQRVPAELDDLPVACARCNPRGGAEQVQVRCPTAGDLVSSYAEMTGCIDVLRVRRARERKLGTLRGSLPRCCVGRDLLWRCLYAVDRLARLFGRPRSEILGRPLEPVLQSDAWRRRLAPLRDAHGPTVAIACPATETPGPISITARQCA